VQKLELDAEFRQECPGAADAAGNDTLPVAAAGGNGTVLRGAGGAARPGSGARALAAAAALLLGGLALAA
jgi:hypothetical protein